MQVPFNFMAAVTICSDFGAQDNKVCHCFCCFPIYLPWSDRTWCLILNFWMLNFKPTFSVSFFTFIKRLFSSSLLSAIRVVSSAYLRLSIFPPAVLIPGGTTSSLAFYIIYSAYKLNKQSDNKQHWYHFSSVQFSQSVVSNSSQPKGLQHARLPCPSPTPRVYSNSCPLSQWCRQTI